MYWGRFWREKRSLKEGEFSQVSNTEKELYRHNSSNFIDAMRLARLTFLAYPVPLGVYYQKSRELFTFQQEVKKSKADLATKLKGFIEYSAN